MSRFARVWVVGDHDDGAVEGVDRFTEQRENVAPGPGVEGAGGLVGEDDLRSGDQGPRDRDSLLLPAGELPRLVPDTVGKADSGCDLREPLLVGLVICELKWEGDVLGGCE
jgi:hypothetical protein